LALRRKLVGIGLIAISVLAFATPLAAGRWPLAAARRKTASLTEIALSGAILKPVTRWITNARRISIVASARPPYQREEQPMRRRCG
jgi:hypothetical protein